MCAGLEDQLLGKLILKEKHELEEQRRQLLEEVQSYKKKIKQLEDDLLFRYVCRMSWKTTKTVQYCPVVAWQDGLALVVLPE
jgi:predicted nuclease with TOPRIM domain